MRIGIIGGGISGLSSAYYLTREGYRVDVFEQYPELGGQIGCLKIGDTHIERYYHIIGSFSSDLLTLIEELGLQDRVSFRESTMGIYAEGKVYPFSSPMDLLRFKPLSLTQRIRFGLNVLKSQRIKEWEPLDPIPIEKWISDEVGRQTFDVLWAPLLRAKFGHLSHIISAAWLWGRIKRQADCRKHGRTKEEMGYLDGGLQTLVDALERDLAERGCGMHTKTKVKRLITENGRIRGLETQKGSHEFDAVISTVAIPEFLELSPPVTDAYRERLDKIQYQGVVNVILVLKKPLSDIFWLNIGDTSIPFGLVVEITNLIGTEKFRGRSVVYLSHYQSTDNYHYRLGRNKLLEEYLPHLGRIFPHFSPDDIEEYFVSKTDYGTPVWETNYGALIPERKTPIENLYMTCTAQMYPLDRATTDCIEYAKIVRDLIVAKAPNARSREAS